jgi:hypothetical protein
MLPTESFFFFQIYSIFLFKPENESHILYTTFRDPCPITDYLIFFLIRTLFGFHILQLTEKGMDELNT